MVKRWEIFILLGYTMKKKKKAMFYPLKQGHPKLYLTSLLETGCKNSYKIDVCTAFQKTKGDKIL